MNLSHLVLREIAHRRLNLLLVLLTIAVAVASAVGLVTLLRGYQVYTTGRVAALDNEIRKITKEMGFNVLILPQDLNLAEFFADDFAEQTMPETHVDLLAQSRDVMTIQHLRPALVRKLAWPEQNRQIIMMGVRGVVPFAHRKAKKPLADPVPPGKIDIGQLLSLELDLGLGDSLTLLGESFEVHKIYPPRGNQDDITVWIDLAHAQQMLGLEGQINMIQALECNCASIDRLAEIDKEVSAVLGDQVQVVELATKAIARAEARTRVSEAGVATLVRVQRLTARLIPLVIVAAGVIVGLLSLANVRQRRPEIGILRALGMRSSQILRVFLAKAALVGAMGAVLGYLLGFFAAVVIQSQWHDEIASRPGVQVLFILPLMLAVLLLTPLLTVMAGWLPALVAATQDPASILHEE